MSLRRLGKSVGASIGKRVGRLTGRLHEARPLDADVLESDDAYLVLFDAPGAETSDVQVRYRGDRVLVRIDRFREFREGYEMLFPGRGLALDGSAELPADAVVRPDAATATLRADGTLAIELPKVPERAAGSEETSHDVGGPESDDHASDSPV